MALTGGCQCGAVRYEMSVEPLAVHVCHCRECQKQSASAFGISVQVPRSGFRVRQGDAKTWPRLADSGRTVDRTSCAGCGSRLWPAGAGPGSGTIGVKGGSLDRPVDLTSAVHVWTSRELPGVLLPEGGRPVRRGAWLWPGSFTPLRHALALARGSRAPVDGPRYWFSVWTCLPTA